MKKVNEFECEIYPRTLWIVYDDVESIKRDFETSDEEAIEEDSFKDSLASCLSVNRKKDGFRGVVIHYTKRLTEEGGSQVVSTISHESVHAANMIMREIGINYTMYQDEHFAYLVGWIARKSWSVLQKIIYP